MTAAIRKPVLRTAVVEAAIPAPRSRVWSALVSGLAAGTVGPQTEGWAEALLSFEAPWRRVARISGFDRAGVAATTWVEHTAAIRDDGDSCLLIWAVVVEVAPDATADALVSVDELVATLEAAMHRWAAQVAASEKASEKD